MAATALLLVLGVAIFADVAKSTVSPADGVSYLRKYGHAPAPDPRKGSLMSAETLAESVRSFQRFAGLPMTGTLDKQTLEKMSAKRCGNSDIAGTENARKKRYVKQGRKWKKTDLKYKFINHSPDLSRAQVEEEVRQAFKWWADASSLTFTKVQRHEFADIEISFANGAHGDGDPFDGAGKTLAHAYFPGGGIGGDAHFDEGERWQLDTRRGGVNLRIVAAHEFGHSLGLSHSDVQQALMAPFYNPSSQGLHTDDILGIRNLYGHPVEKTFKTMSTTRPPRTTTTRRPRTTTTTTRRTRTTTTQSPPAGSCNGRFDAVTTLANGSTYAFVNHEFWHLTNNGADEYYPQSTHSVWGIKGKIDAALTYSTHTDLFQGHKVYRFAKGRLESGYPLHISTVYKGIPSRIDTAFQWSGNAKIYFMKGDKYWRYNPYSREPDPGYPRPLTNWRGLPTDGIDAAMQWNGRTYFFKNGRYYRFDDREIQVAKSNQYPYPRRTDEWWLGCKDNTLMSGAEKRQSENEDSADGGHNAGFTPTASVFLISMSTISLFISSWFLSL